jgi:GT2 family glycosyltransferase
MEHGRSVTTVVVSRNRRDELLGTLPRHRRPVILIDNASTDDSVAAVTGSVPDVRIIRLSSNHGATARNIGVQLAETPYVAFADDDSWWEDDSLDRAASTLDANPRVGLLAARILLGPSERRDPLCDVMAASPLPRAPDLPGTPVLGFAACGAIVRRSSFLAVGGFDEVVFFLGEEARLAIDLAAAGWQLCYDPELVVHHYPSVRREGRDVRAALVARNDLLTAVMRRPWPTVVRTAHHFARSRNGRQGLRDAVPRLPAALSRRRRIPAQLERDLRSLSRR